MLNVKKILVPVDASEVSLNALTYARQYAQKQKIELTVLHVGSYHDDFSGGGLTTYDSATIREKRMETVKERIHGLFKAGEELPEIRYEIGFPVDVIDNLSESYDLIIMGSTGEHDLMDKMLGSVSSGVAQRAHCPVLLLPNGHSYSNWSQIAFACDSNHLDDKVLSSFLRISHDETDATVNFVEVVKKGEEGKIDEAINQLIQEQALEIADYSWSSITHDSVIEGLNEYATEKNMDVVVMVTKHRNLIQNLLHKSKTKNMVMRLQHPLLVLHNDDKVFA